MSRVTVEGRVAGDVLDLTWSDARSQGSCRFDRIPGTRPEWLGEMDELLRGAGRRQERAVLAAVEAWAETEGFELGLWSDGEDVEILGSSSTL